MIVPCFLLILILGIKRKNMFNWVTVARFLKVVFHPLLIFVQFKMECCLGCFVLKKSDSFSIESVLRSFYYCSCLIKHHKPHLWICNDNHITKPHY